MSALLNDDLVQASSDTPSKADGRTMILCFDASGYKPGKVSIINITLYTLLNGLNLSECTCHVYRSSLSTTFLMFHQTSNVARLFRALRKDVREKQVVYYQVRSMDPLFPSANPFISLASVPTVNIPFSGGRRRNYPAYLIWPLL